MNKYNSKRFFRRIPQVVPRSRSYDNKAMKKSPLKVEVCRIAPGQGEIIRSLVTDSLTDSPNAFPGDPAYVQTVTPESWNQRSAMASFSMRSAIFVAWIGNGPAGLAEVHCSPEEDEARISRLWVHPKFRLYGVGAKLLTVALTFATETPSPLARVVLWVTLGNTSAERLYERAGFRKTGETRPFREGSELVQAQYARALNPPAMTPRINHETGAL